MAYKLTDKISFGRHKGEAIQDIIDDDITYIEWAIDTVDGFELDDDALEFFNEALDEYLFELDIADPDPYTDW